MKKQITIVGKYELSREDVICYITEGLLRDEKVNAKSFVFEPTLERVIVTVDSSIETTPHVEIDDPYHPIAKIVHKGARRPNYGISNHFRPYLADLKRRNVERGSTSSECVDFTFREVKLFFLKKFPQLTDEALRHYLLRTDMQKRSGVEIVLADQKTDTYTGWIRALK